MQSSLWMKLHERFQYKIDLTLRFNFIKIDLNLELGWNFTFWPITNLNDHLGMDMA
jgi:hypothetical protein